MLKSILIPLKGKNGPQFFSFLPKLYNTSDFYFFSPLLAHDCSKFEMVMHDCSKALYTNGGVLPRGINSFLVRFLVQVLLNLCFRSLGIFEWCIDDSVCFFTLFLSESLYKAEPSTTQLMYRF